MIFQSRDVVMAIGVFGKKLDSTVSEIMSSPVIHVSPEESILEAAEIMAKKNIRKIPVVDNGKVTGLISTTDIMVLFTMCKEEDLRKIFGPFLK